MSERPRTHHRIHSIATHLVMVQIAVVMLVAGMVGAAGYHVIARHLAEEQPHQLSSAVDMIAYHTEVLFEGLGERLRRIAEAPAVESYRRNGNPIPIERLFHRSADTFSLLGYINDTGHEEIRVTQELISETPRDLSETPLYRGATQTPNALYVGTLSHTEIPEEPLLELAYTHQDYFDQVHGTILAGISVSHIAQAVKMAHLEEQWFAVIADASGRIIYSPRAADLDRELANMTDTGSRLVAALRGGEAVDDGWHHLLGRESKIAMKEIPGIGWKVLVAAPRDVLEVPLIQMRNYALATSALVLMLALGVALFMGRRVAHPIVDLTRAVSEISGDADLSRRVEISRRDEIGELARGFNRMLERLNRAYSDTAEARYLSDNILTQMVDPLIIVTPQGEISRVNPAASRLLGERQLLGQSIRKLFPDPECFASLSSGEQAKISGLETRVYTSDGREAPVLLSAAMMEGSDTGSQGIVIQVRDITESKRAEQERQSMEIQLRHAQKLEAVGQLAAGIAHEINTPTQFVNDNMHFLQEAFADYGRLFAAYNRLTDAAASGTVPDELVTEVKELAEEVDVDYLKEEIPQAVEQSLEGLGRIAKIVHAMKEFSHPGTEEKIPTDLNRAIETTIDVSRNEWKYSAELITELAPELPQVPVLAGEFNQVMLNLIVNAAHAINDVVGESGEMGEIRITMRQDGEWAEIRVSDTGKGIPEKIKKRIFDPFFTTKEVGKGSGQGLAIAWSTIVDKHGGTIEVESEEGKGSTFIIRLPIKQLDPDRK